MTIILVLVFTAIGLRAMSLLPIDASPDVTPNVVTVVTDAPGLGAVEVEKLITFPVEVSMRGLTGISEIRSISRFGLFGLGLFLMSTGYLFRSAVGHGASASGGVDDPEGLRAAGDDAGLDHSWRDLPVSRG